MPSHAERAPGRVRELFRVFLRLGLTSFGGPIAHLAYFREEFVGRRGWLSDTEFAQLLSVCQFLPGPASSQMGFAIGLFRGGWRGALAAFVAFTLPSALLMFGFAAMAPSLGPGSGAAAVHGLKLVAVAVVAHGLLGMVRQLVPDVPRVLIAAAAVATMLLIRSVWAPSIAIALGGLLGALLCRRVTVPPARAFPVRYGHRRGIAFLVAFLIGLAGALLWPSTGVPTIAGLGAAFYRAGALVFGGGHVVLPLLQQAVVENGWVDANGFLAGYGAAQAMPGPMFSMAAYLGAEVPLSLPAAAGALIGLLGIFLPGFLLLMAVLPMWARLTRHPWAPRTMAGINAAVVGLLAAAFHDPVWTQGIRGPGDVAIAAIGFLLLVAVRVSAIWTVLWCITATIAISLLK